MAAPRSAPRSPTIQVRGRPPIDPNSDQPVPLAVFAQAIAGTPEEVWLTLLRQSHGRERYTIRGWRGLIDMHGQSLG